MGPQSGPKRDHPGAANNAIHRVCTPKSAKQHAKSGAIAKRTSDPVPAAPEGAVAINPTPSRDPPKDIHRRSPVDILWGIPGRGGINCYGPFGSRRDRIRRPFRDCATLSMLFCTFGCANPVDCVVCGSGVIPFGSTLGTHFGIPSG